MAKETPKKEEPVAEVAAAAPRFSKKLIIIIAVAVLVLGGASAAAYLLLFKSKPAVGPDGKEIVAEESEAEHAAPTFDPKKPPVFVNLEPFTVNLQPEGSGDQFLQIVVTLRVQDDKIGEQIKQYMPQIRHEMLALMSALRPSEVSPPAAREALAEELVIVINEVLGHKPPEPPKNAKPDWKPQPGPVVAVFFTQFIVQ